MSTEGTKGDGMDPRIERVLEAARVMCQWLDYHAAEVSSMEPEAVKAAEEMHGAVVAYETEVLGLKDES